MYKRQGKTSSGNEPKDENEQIIEDVFGNKSTLDESQVPKKGFFARLKYRLEQMKAKHIEEDKAEEEAERLEEEEKQKNKDCLLYTSRPRSEAHIVIAEDSPLLIKLISDSLVKSGYDNLTLCHNGRCV